MRFQPNGASQLLHKCIGVLFQLTHSGNSCRPAIARCRHVLEECRLVKATAPPDARIVECLRKLSKYLHYEDCPSKLYMGAARRMLAGIGLAGHTLDSHSVSLRRLQSRIVTAPYAPVEDRPITPY